MDAIWRASEVSVKESLAEELIAHEAELAEDFYGRIVMRNCNVAHYRRKQAVWQEKVATATKTKELFHDILTDLSTTDTCGPSSKKKRKCNSDILTEDGLPELSGKRRKKPKN